MMKELLLLLLVVILQWVWFVFSIWIGFAVGGLWWGLCWSCIVFCLNWIARPSKEIRAETARWG